MNNSLKTYLFQRLQQELPGKLAQIEAIPYRKIDYGTFSMDNAKKSAVLILFYLQENEPHIVLIQRPVYNGAHSGQIAFPGGKVEESDKDIVYTALREANEEIGIVIDDVDVVGGLTDMYIPISNFLVTPIVGFINYLPNFILEEREVAEIINLKVSDLTNINELDTTKVNFTNNRIVNVPCFDFNGKIVWGATAVMLNELRWVLNGR
ncbi:MAG: coenzyme A pyrophosphatase [Flavobacteriales bacterium]|nr:MAG: coenzyme A pyrophosphatase [Flavobacteriales bacterium]